MFKNSNNFLFKRVIRKVNFGFLSLLLFLFFYNQLTAQSKVIDVDSFNKVIVSPHIEVVFKAADTESVSVEFITVPIDKLNVLVENNTLNVYLEGARITTAQKKEHNNKMNYSSPLYEGTTVRAIITYRKINSLDLRGKEKLVFENKLESEKLTLKIYGNSQVYMNEVEVQNLHTSIYGKSYLEIQNGKTHHQKFTAYGESKVNTLNVENKETILTAYGDGVFQFNVSDKLKVTSYGEAKINYSGNPELQKGLIIGKTKITSLSF